MDYPCGKFGNVFSAVLVLSCGENTETDVDERFTPTTLVGVSTCKYCHSSLW